MPRVLTKELENKFKRSRPLSLSHHWFHRGTSGDAVTVSILSFIFKTINVTDMLRFVRVTEITKNAKDLHVFSKVILCIRLLSIAMDH